MNMSENEKFKVICNNCGSDDVFVSTGECVNFYCHECGNEEDN